MKLVSLVPSSLLVIACLSASHAQELSVVEGVIYYTNTNATEYSNTSDESVIENTAGQVMQINVRDHVVIRGVDEKSSFTPLSAISSELSDTSLRAQSVFGFELPESYKAISTLHLRFFNESGDSKNTCEVLILDNLLDQTHRARLHEILTVQKADFEIRDGYIAAQCRRDNGDQES